MVNWKDVHEDFGKYDLLQKNWEEKGFTYEETKAWIDAGFNPFEYGTVFYLKQHNYTPEQYSNFKSKNAQEYLDYFYPKEIRSKITELDIRSKRLEGSLKLEKFTNLKKFNCFSNRLTNLDLSHCVNLEELDCSWNELNNLNFLNSLNEQKLVILNAGSNDNFPVSDLTLFSKFANLETLRLNNNHFYGSLKPLQRLGKLKSLSINNTDIDSGLEYLPESIEEFNCSAERKNAKVKVIANLLEKAEGENFSQKLQAYKEKQKARELLKEEFQAEDQRIIELKQQIQILQKDNQDLNTKLNQSNQTIRDVQKSLEEAQEKNTNLTQELKQTQLKKLSIEAETRTKQEINVLQQPGTQSSETESQKLIDLRKELDKAKKLVQTYIEKDQKLTQDLTALQKGLEFSQVEVQRIISQKEEVFQLRIELTKAEIELKIRKEYSEKQINQPSTKEIELLKKDIRDKKTQIKSKEEQIARLQEQNQAYLQSLTEKFIKISASINSVSTEPLGRFTKLGQAIDVIIGSAEELITGCQGGFICYCLDKLKKNKQENQQTGQQALQVQPTYGTLGSSN